MNPEAIAMMAIDLAERGRCDTDWIYNRFVFIWDSSTEDEKREAALVLARRVVEK